MSKYEAEYLLSELYNLNPPRLKKRMIETRRMKQIKNVFQKFKDEFKRTIVSFDGYKNKCPRFTVSGRLRRHKSLSVRTSLVKRTKVYPQFIGRVSKKHFFHKIKQMRGFHTASRRNLQFQYNNNDKDVKQFIIDNLGELMNTYLECLFHTDYTLWIYGNNHNDVKNHKYVIVNANHLPNLSEASLARDVKTWNQFNKVKYKGITIGEFRLSKKGRIEFGFFIHKLLNVIEMGQAAQSLLIFSSDGEADEVDEEIEYAEEGSETETDSVSTTSTLTVGSVTDVSSDDSYHYISFDGPNRSISGRSSVFCTALKNIFCFINLSIPLTILIVLLVSEYEKNNN